MTDEEFRETHTPTGNWKWVFHDEVNALKEHLLKPRDFDRQYSHSLNEADGMSSLFKGKTCPTNYYKKGGGTKNDYCSFKFALLSSINNVHNLWYFNFFYFNMKPMSKFQRLLQEKLNKGVRCHAESNIIYAQPCRLSCIVTFLFQSFAITQNCLAVRVNNHWLSTFLFLIFERSAVYILRFFIIKV